MNQQTPSAANSAATPTTQPEDYLPTAIILTFTTFLISELAEKIKDHHLNLRVFSTVYQPHFPEATLIDKLELIPDHSPDYFFCLYPSLSDSPTLHIQTITSLAGNAKITFIDDFETSSNYTNLNANTTVCLTQDAYGYFDPNYPINDFQDLISAAINGGRIYLPQDQTRAYAPVHSQDLSQAIIKSTFTNQTGNFIYLSSLDKVTPSDLAQVFEKSFKEVKNQDLSIEFTTSSAQNTLPDDLTTTSQAKITWTPELKLEQGMRATLKSFAQSPALPPENPIPTNTVTSAQVGDPLINQNYNQTTIQPSNPPSNPPSDLPSDLPSDPTLPEFEPEPTPIIPPKPEPILESNPLTPPLNPDSVTNYQPLTSPNTKPPKISTISSHKLTIKVPSAIPLFKTIIVTLLLTLITSSSWFLIKVITGSNQLKNSIESLQDSDPDQAGDLALKASSNLNSARSILQTYNHYFILIPNKTYQKYDKILDAGVRLSTAITTTSHIATQADLLYSHIVGESDQNFYDLTLSLQSDLESSYNELSLIEASIKDIDFHSRFGLITQLNNAKKELPQLRENLQLALTVIKILPDLIGTSTPTSYLLVLQNNLELRPSGGFITAAALLTFQDGQLVSIKLDDVYTLDSKLEGEVLPPEELGQFLGGDSWYLKDANWSPDFNSSARQIEWFYQKEVGNQPRGTIGINIPFLKDLLKYTEPLSISSTNTPIDSNNIIDYIANNSQVDFQEEGNMPEVSTLILDQLLEKMTQKQLPLSGLLTAINTSLNNSNVTISLLDSNLQSIIEQNGWDGGLTNSDCVEPFSLTSCINETFGIFEANVGINRANYFLSREISHHTNIDQSGTISHQLTFTYTNTSTSNSWPAGKYKTFTRIYLPQGTLLNDSSFNGEKLEPYDFSLDPLAGLLELSFIYEVAPQTQAQLILDLTSPQVLNTNGSSSALNINWQKQPGSTSDPLTFSLDYPETLTISQINQQAVNNLGNTTFKNLFSKDTEFSVLFINQP